jgi:metallophosphoesterase (TIGR00282 family)
MNKLRILFLGDIVGSTGRAMFQKHIGQLRAKYAIDAVVVNGENSAHGHGITSKIMKFFKEHGVDVVTSGNHIWRNKEIYSYLSEHQDLLRPANFPRENPGVGVTTFMCKGVEVAIVNLQGRIFMREQVACPFKTAESILTYLQSKTKLIFVDFHAETTAEKIGLGFFLDGKISGLVGTHTHVPTADERILPQGTAFITDLGMAGSRNSMIGMKKDAIIRNMITQMPTQFEVETVPPVIMTGAWIDVDTATGRALAIERVSDIDNELHGQGGE